MEGLYVLLDPPFFTNFLAFLPSLASAVLPVDYPYEKVIIVYHREPPKLRELPAASHGDLKIYGQDKVGLLRSEDQCHFVIKGKDQRGRTVANLYWNPHYLKP